MPYALPDVVGMLSASASWLDIMAAPRRVIDISIEADDLMQLERIARSRTEPASWVERARILLAYRADPSAHAVGEMVGVTHQTVLRCLRWAVRFGVMAALDDSPWPGKAPEITADARVWLLSLACVKSLLHLTPFRRNTHNKIKTISPSPGVIIGSDFITPGHLNTTYTPIGAKHPTLSVRSSSGLYSRASP